MSAEDKLKITCHFGSQKKVNYTYVTTKGFREVKSYISHWLFTTLNYPKCDIRYYWIDSENDDVDIVSEEDYSFFYNYSAKEQKNLWHLHVATVEKNSGETANAKTGESSPSTTSTQSKVPPADGSYEFAVHDHVECDGCLMAPIVGFRYKCIQCPNYDLCQNCESKHFHSEHMMVRMPTNNCPSVVESYITGRFSERKHGKRAKASCPFVKNGISVIVDSNSGENSNAEQSTPSNGKERVHGHRHHRRHQRNNFLAHLYDMMHDLAEGGGAAAAAHAFGAEATSSSTKTTRSTSGPFTTTTTTTTNKKDFENTDKAADIIAAQIAAQKAHESALKSAEIATKVAHETAVQAAKNITGSMFAPTAASAAQTDTNTKEKEVTNDNVNDTTSPSDGCTAKPFIPSLVKNNAQIVHNLNEMVGIIIDYIASDIERKSKCSSSYPCNTNLRKNSTTSTKSSLNSTAKESEKEKSIEKQQNDKETAESDVSSNIEIEDIGSDSENDSVSESFIKLDAPKENNTTKTTTANSSAQTTPPQSLNKSNVMDFAQLSANLKAHIAEEAAKSASTSIETGVVATEHAMNSTNTSATAGKPVVTTTATTTTSTTNKERQPLAVYHADDKINTAVHAMMAMGFSNEGNWLTQLLVSVNGNIPDALDVMAASRCVGQYDD